MQIEVKDGNTIRCYHWGYWTLIIIMLALSVFSTYIALRNSKPVCTDLRPAQVNSYTRTLECVYDLGDIQEDEANVIIVHDRIDYIK